MCKMIKDKRLFNIHNLNADENVFEFFDLQDISDEIPYQFVNDLDHVKGGAFGHRQRDEDIQDLLSEIEKYFDEYKDEDWVYVERVLHEYDTCYLSSPVLEQCDKVLKANEEVWFAWVESIEFTGIQSLFLQFAKSIQCLISFLVYLQKHPVETRQREYLVTLLIHTLINHLNRIDSNIRVASITGQKNDFLNLAKWNEEADSYISEFVKILFDFPKAQYQNVLYSMLSNIWIYDEERNKFLMRIRGKILEHFVAVLSTEEDVKKLLNDTRLGINKSAVHHKLLIYMQWALTNNRTIRCCQNILWEQLVTCIETKGTYLHYHQKDDQLFSWICAKLLADEEKPIKKIESIVCRYHQRFGGWNQDKFENFYQRGRAYLFFLSVGAMSTEWLLREGRKRLAGVMIRFIFSEGVIALDNLPSETDDVLNFIQQTWARRALFMRKDTGKEDVKNMLNALDAINTIEYRLTAIHVFLINLSKKDKGIWFKDTFKTGVAEILNTDMMFLDYRSSHFDNEVNMMKEKVREITALLNSKID